MRENKIRDAINDLDQEEYAEAERYAQTAYGIERDMFLNPGKPWSALSTDARRIKILTANKMIQSSKNDALLVDELEEQIKSRSGDYLAHLSELADLARR